MKILTKDLKVGKQYAYIDGWVFATDRQNLKFDGWHARHDLSGVPQLAGLKDRELLVRTLESKEYWQDRKVGHH